MSTISFWEDRYTQGAVAGLIGWLPQMLFMQSMHWFFHATRFQYLDYAAIITWEHEPGNLGQYLFAELVVILVCAFYGALFAMAIKGIHSPGLLLKGALFALVNWFLFMCVFTFFKINLIYRHVDFRTAAFSMAGVLVWGIVTAAALGYLNRRCEVKN